jgi:branched-chain amino acid transport system substrate-binding protein
VHKRRHSLPLAVCVLTLLVAVASGMSRVAAVLAGDAMTPIKVGVLAPLTGPLTALARDIVDGGRLYVDEVNGEMVGRKVELIVEDYEFKSAVALTKTKKLVEQDRVHIVVGVILSAAALAMKEYIHAQQMPLIISGAAVAEPLMMEKPSPYVFRTTFGASQVPPPLAKFTYDKLQARTATVIAADTVGTIELVMAFARAFEEAGGKVVQELYAPRGHQRWGCTRLSSTSTPLIPPEISNSCKRFARNTDETREDQGNPPMWHSLPSTRPSQPPQGTSMIRPSF